MNNHEANYSRSFVLSIGLAAAIVGVVSGMIFGSISDSVDAAGAAERVERNNIAKPSNQSVANHDDPTTRIHTLTLAIESQPDDAQLYAERANTYLVMNAWRDASVDFEQAMLLSRERSVNAWRTHTLSKVSWL